MGLADRDYTRAGARRAWPTGRIRSASPRGGPSASFILIVLCSAVFFLDLALPKTRVQSSAWEVSPVLRKAVAAVEAAQAEVDRVALVAKSRGDTETVARLLAERSELDVVLEQRLQRLEAAEDSWDKRRARNDFAVAYEPQPGGGVLGVAFDPKLPPGTDPLALARFDEVGPIRAWLQFTTVQAMWVPQKWGAEQGFQAWRFIGYGLLHVNLTHLVFNMIGLWVFGAIVEQAFGRLRFFALFTLSVVIGALLYFLLNVGGLAVLGATDQVFIVPGLLFNNPYLPLIGASAGVYGVILAAAWLKPEEDIYLFFLFPVPLRYFALAIIGIAVLTLLQHGQNAGGEAAHLGGAIAGWWIAQRPHLLDDFFPFFHRIDGRRAPRPARREASVSEAEIDRILDKVREQGLGSLTERERESLRTATNDHRTRDGR